METHRPTQRWCHCPSWCHPRATHGHLWQSVIQTQGHSVYILDLTIRHRSQVTHTHPERHGTPSSTNTRSRPHCGTLHHTQQPQQPHLVCQAPTTHPSPTQVCTDFHINAAHFSRTHLGGGVLSYALIRCFLCNHFIKCLCNLCGKNK